MHGPFNRRSKRKLSSEINVVPFIDVMLVLLVIFMITAPMMNQGVEVQLPQASAQAIDSDTPPLIVSVDSSGEYYMSRDGDNTPVSLDTLGAQVQSVLAEQPQTPVMVRGDRNVPYGQVITLMAALQRAGVPNVGLISEPGAGN